MSGPAARIIRTPRDAEIAARDWLAHFGDSDARLGTGSADGGVDAESDRSVAQVKAGETPTGRPVIQQIFGVAAVENKRALVFSVAPFTEEAIEWAGRSGVALFRMDLTGAVQAVNERAEHILSSVSEERSGWDAVTAELELQRRLGHAASISSLFEAPDGFRGYWCVAVDQAGHVTATRDLAGAATRSFPAIDQAVQSVAAALRNVGAGYWDCRPVLTIADEVRPFRPRPTYEQAAHPRPAETAPRLRVTASDIYKLVASPTCGRRLYLEARGETGSPPTAFGSMLIEGGIDLERQYLSSLEQVLDLSEGSLEERSQRTLDAMDSRQQTIYQPVLRCEVVVDGRAVELVGSPDFLAWERRGAVIRDTKTAVRISQTERPDIAAQLGFYGWLYELVTGSAPAGLEVVAGDGQIHMIDPVPPAELEELVARAVRLKEADHPPDCLVKWSDRGSCPFFERCWDDALAADHIVALPGVSRALASALEAEGVVNSSDLLARFDEESLAAVEFREGSRTRTVGDAADDILRAAWSLQTQEPIQHAPLDLPPTPLVLFDLEGIPRFGTSPGIVYLWGMKLLDTVEHPYQGVFAATSNDSDERGWFEFLEAAGNVLEVHGPDTPFVHWASYEKTQIVEYLERYGDQGGVGVQVLENLVDLLAAVRRGITLPVRSYSLKVVEAFVGFQRTQTEFGGNWSIVQWQEAVAASSLERRRALLKDLARYNEEDLQGLGAVYSWLSRRATG